MTRRSIFASIMGLFCVRKVPAAEPSPAPAVKMGDVDALIDEMSMHQRHLDLHVDWILHPGTFPHIKKSLHWQTGIDNKTWHGK